MKSKDMKKLLASLGVAGLISAGGISLPGPAAAAGSGWSGTTPSAGSTDEQMHDAAASGWSGTMHSAGSAAEEQVKSEADEVKEEATKAATDEAEQAEDTAKKKAKMVIEGCWFQTTANIIPRASWRGSM